VGSTPGGTGPLINASASGIAAPIKE
jgi:hypothetical protein